MHQRPPPKILHTGNIAWGLALTKLCVLGSEKERALPLPRHLADRSSRLGIKNPISNGPCKGVGHPQKPAHKKMFRCVVKGFRGPHLKHLPFVHHRDAIRKRQGLLLIVGDVDRGEFKGIVYLTELAAEIHPEPGIKSREGLI